MNANAVQQEITIPIMHCFDNNYVIPAAVSFYSMLENANKEYCYKLFVLHNDITYQSQIKLTQIVHGFPNASIEFIDMTDSFKDIWESFQFIGHYSKEVLYKLLVPSIFPQYDKLIITDVDVVFLGDISESFFSFDVKEKIFFAGVHQIMPKNSWLETYYQNYDEHFGKNSIKELKVCGGYLVANLKQLREHEMEARFIAFMKQNAYRLLQAEQDVINFCCKQEEIRLLPLNYVVCSYQYDLYDGREENLDSDLFYKREAILDSLNHPIQLHYATGTKPWNSPASTKADIWFYYLAKCGLFYDYMKKERVLLEDIVEFISNEDIRKGGRRNNSPMLVSILCCTYNHEGFIRDTLESLVSQEADFPYEIIVADDASSDSTRDIIEEYHIKYPGLIVPILREVNVGIGINYYDALQHVRGRFLAICDGDDCWIDRLKLKKQVDFLMCNHEYNLCCSSCIKHQVETGEDFLYNPEDYIKSAIAIKEYYTFKDLLYCRFISSCTVMMRWQLRDMVPEFLANYEVIDFPLILIHAAGGRIKVMADEVFAKYNLHSQGITSTRNDKVERETRCLINEVNQFLDYRFSKTVSQYYKDYKQYMAWMRKQKEKERLDSAQKHDEQLPQEETSSVSEKESTKKHLKRTFYLKDALCAIYRECVPEVIKRVWRLFKKALILIYRECIPNIFKRFYRATKGKLLQRG